MLAPYHETLYAYYHLSEHKWIDALTRDAEGLQGAKRTAIAFHQPQDLEDERRDFLDRVGALPSHEDALAIGYKMIEELAKIDARREAEINKSVGIPVTTEATDSGQN